MCLSCESWTAALPSQTPRGPGNIRDCETSLQPPLRGCSCFSLSSFVGHSIASGVAHLHRVSMKQDGSVPAAGTQKEKRHGGSRALTHEIHLYRGGDDAAFVAHAKQLADSFFSIFAVIERPLV